MRSFKICCGDRNGKGYAWVANDVNPLIVVADNSREALGSLILELTCIYDFEAGVKLDITSSTEVPDWVLKAI